MPGKYVPLLRWKRGERSALAKLSAAAKFDAVPFVLLGADNFKDKKATKKAAGLNAPARFAAELYSEWGATPVYLDASPVPLDPAGVHPLISIAAAVRSIGCRLIPAASPSANAQYLSAVSAVKAIDNAGVCLRVTLAEMTAMPAWISSWPHALAETDLIVDVGNSAENVLALGGAVNAAFGTLYLGANWRTVTFAGTSIPDNFAGLSAGKYVQPRSEALLWDQIVKSGLPYNLRYGDYATVSTATPAPGIAWGYPITVKYTLDAAFLICRGVRTKGIGAVDMAPQLISHAKAIVAHAGRGALANCWADGVIDKIAVGSASPQGLEHWVTLGVNRHVELVCSILP